MPDSPNQEGRVSALASLIATVEATLHATVREKRMKLDWTSLVVLTNDAMKFLRGYRSLSGAEKHAVVMGALKVLLRRDGVLSDGDQEILEMADEVLPMLINGLYKIASPDTYKIVTRGCAPCFSGLKRRRQ